MRELTGRYQVIKHQGKPIFVLVPYDEFVRLVGGDDAVIPHEVVGLAVENDWPLLKAWRKYLGLTQKELAERAGVSLSVVSRMERSFNRRSETLKKLADAMGLSVEQLVDEE